MAGNIYLTNNEKARRFIDITSDYIVDNLKRNTELDIRSKCIELCI